MHYRDGQKYDLHHDWGGSGYPDSRYLTLLLYLSDMEGPDAGGETAFPKGADGAGFKVQPARAAQCCSTTCWRTVMWTISLRMLRCQYTVILRLK